MRDPLDHLRLDSRPGPARPLDFDRARAMVQAALDQAHLVEAPAPVHTDRTLPEPKIWKHSRARRWILPAAALFLVLSTGASAAWLYRTILEPAPSPPIHIRKRHPSRQAPPHVETPVIPIEVPKVHPDPSVPSPPPKTRRPESPDELLRKANRLRRKGRHRAAERTYMRIVKRAPRSDAAYVASIAAASIRLENLGDPAGAIRAYTQAVGMKPEGSLDSEILFGLSEAYRKLQRTSDERTSLRRLLDRHPQSAYAARARARLEELE